MGSYEKNKYKLIKGSQPIIYLFSNSEQFCSLINIRYKTNLKAKYFIFKKTFPKIPEVPLPLKSWLPEQNVALKTWLSEQNLSLKYWYRNRMWLSNIGTRTKCVSQKLVPEQKLVQPVFVPEPIFERHLLFRYQYLRVTFCSSTNIWEPHSVPILIFESQIVFR